MKAAQELKLSAARKGVRYSEMKKRVRRNSGARGHRPRELREMREEQYIHRLQIALES